MVIAVVLVFGADRATPAAPFNLIAGPYARLLAQAVDLGPARGEHVQLTAELSDGARPVALAVRRYFATENSTASLTAYTAPSAPMAVGV